MTANRCEPVHFRSGATWLNPRERGEGEVMVTLRKSWRQTLYVFAGGMTVWFGLLGAVALHG